MNPPKPNPPLFQPASLESPWLDCPVCKDTQRLSKLSKDMVRTMRRLRRELKACAKCPIEPGDCPIRQNLSSQIQTAVQEVVDEWNLS